MGGATGKLHVDHARFTAGGVFAGAARLDREGGGQA